MNSKKSNENELLGTESVAHFFSTISPSLFEFHVEEKRYYLVFENCYDGGLYLEQLIYQAVMLWH